MPAVGTRNCCQGTDPCRQWVPESVVRGHIHAGVEYQELLSGDRSMPAVGTRNCCKGTDPCRDEYQELFSGDRPMPAVSIRNYCQGTDPCWP